MEKCISSTPVKNEHSFYKTCTKKGAHLQCVNNHSAKFEYKDMNTVGVKITQTRHPLSNWDGKNVLVQHLSKMRKKKR